MYLSNIKKQANINWIAKADNYITFNLGKALSNTRKLLFREKVLQHTNQESSSYCSFFNVNF